MYLQAKPTAHFVKKYGRPKSFNIMPVNSIRVFGRQLLETLRFLQEKGFPYGEYRKTSNTSPRLLLGQMP